ncbi:transmembrane protein 209 [Aplysia californica]|uniref:Transmembrane protein 209 n=1 Tax=Aplysia californica TaxID=6500 RepID=A0ABM0JI55_APLCA|nr:transmembrane protein 209 [Aplysia californica]
MASVHQDNNIVDNTWRKQHLTQAARQAVLSSLKIVFIFVILFADMSYSIVSGPLSIDHPIVWFVELSIAVLLLFQIVSNGLFLCRYFWSYLFGSTVSVTEKQRRLMAIPLNDKSFRTPPRNLGGPSSSTPLTFSAGDSSQFLSRSFTSPSPNVSYSSPLHSSATYGSPYGSFLSSSSGKASFNASPNSSLDRSLNLSGMSQSFGRPEYDRTSLRSRRSTSLPVSSRSSKYKHITDVDTLNRYIQEEEEREMNKSQVSPDNLSSGNVSFWSYGSNPLDFTQVLRRFAYQLAPRTPASLTLRSSSDQGNSLGMEEVWGKYNVTEDDLYVWTEKLRKWLSFTIVSRLNEEIEEINSKLQKVNTEDRIGKAGVSALKQIAMTKLRSYIPTLNSIFPYLEFTANQEYLYKRLRDLSTGSMSAYTWSKGGSYGKPWSEHLPTDAALVMHMFCCYLDARLPVQPKHSDGKPFTSQHFIKTPDKPNADKKETLQIYQSSINPPHFQVVIGSETHNLCKGRNNMFQAILLLLYHIRVKESGMLGRINLGMSGLNMLWIFD